MMPTAAEELQGMQNNVMTTAVMPNNGSSGPITMDPSISTGAVGGSLSAAVMPPSGAPDTPAYSYTPETDTAGGVERYDAATVDVGRESTVAGQMEGLLSRSNPYIDASRTRAAERANTRGMLNTSIAAGAGERAAIESSMPIAQQDAQTFAQAGMADTAAINEASQYGSEAFNIARGEELARTAEAGMQNAKNELDVILTDTRYTAEEAARQSQLLIDQKLASGELTADQARIAAQHVADRGMATLGHEQELAMQDATLQAKKDFAEFDAGIQTQLGALNQEYALELESLRQEYNIQGKLTETMGAMYNQQLSSIATILGNDKLSAKEQQNSVKILIDNLGSGLSFLSGLEGPSGSFSGAGGTATGGATGTTGGSTTGTSSMTSNFDSYAYAQAKDDYAAQVARYEEAERQASHGGRNDMRYPTGPNIDDYFVMGEPSYESPDSGSDGNWAANLSGLMKR